MRAHVTIARCLGPAIRPPLLLLSFTCEAAGPCVMSRVRTTSSGVESTCATQLAAEPHTDDSSGLSLRRPRDEAQRRCNHSYT